MKIRHAPLTPKLFLRAFAKAVIGLVCLNIICLLLNFDPAVALIKLNVSCALKDGESRLLYSKGVNDNLADIVIPIDAALATHKISCHPKTQDEYRVIFIGDSQTTSAVYSEIINADNLHVAGKKVVAYNLGWPGTDIVQDVLILDAAMQYQPDLVVLSVTAASFNDVAYPNDNPVGWFRTINKRRLAALSRKFDLQDWFEASMQPEAWYEQWVAIDNSEWIMNPIIPAWINRFSYLSNFTKVDYLAEYHRTDYYINKPIPPTAIYHSDDPGFMGMPNTIWKFLNVAQQLSDQHQAKLMLINEPTFNNPSVDNNDKYSNFYEKKLYDRYRVALKKFADKYHFWYFDWWDIVPPDAFTDSPLHMIPEASKSVTEKIISVMVQQN
jgi:hypothetical protein